MPLSAGDRLGRYEILAPLGAGGMGEVYRARDTELERDVAIKVLPEEVARDPERLARFDREARVVARLSHPNILEIWDFGHDGDTTYGVTELLEGETLRQRLERGSSASRNSTEIGAAIADGLAAAHGKGIVHRDLKPENIFITSDGRVKILDFGLAQVKEPLDVEADTATLTPADTAPGTVVGTVGYMSPEQVRGRPADERSDIFALGCVLYEMLTGQKAFPRDSTADTQAAILKEEPTPVGKSGVALPAELERTIHRCLEKSPDARFQSASDLAYNLRSVSAERLAAGGRAARPVRARWTHILAVAIATAIALLVVLPPEGLWHRFSGTGEERPPIRSIALLPLENLTGDPDQDYFVDGLHEELIATFAQISAFHKVIARTSVMRFRDTDIPIREIGERLDVEGVLEGSVRQSGDTVRATFQLIDARTESHLWADSFQRGLTDILALQSEVAQAVAREVQLALTPEEERRLADTRRVDKDAYRLYLQGVRPSPWIASEQNLEEARRLFDRAIEIDPTYADAYVGLSRTLMQLAHYYRPASEVMPEALAAVERAMELDDDLSAAHSRLGTIKQWWQWDLTAAEAEYRRGLDLNPNGGYELQRYAELLAVTGRAEEASILAERAVQVDPLNADTLGAVGWVYYLSRRFDEGIEQMSLAKEMYPTNSFISWDLAMNYTAVERFEDAARELSRAIALSPGLRRSPLFLSSLVWVTAGSGRVDEARGLLGEILTLAESQHVPSTNIAFALFSVGDIEGAIGYLQRAFEDRETQLMSLVPCASVDPLRSDVRFQRILRDMGFPDEWR